jgi:uncharacterized protein (DUF433 family)
MYNIVQGGLAMEILERITIEPGKRSGQPCIRALRITVWDVLGWLAAGMTEEQILDDYLLGPTRPYRASITGKG